LRRQRPAALKARSAPPSDRISTGEDPRDTAQEDNKDPAAKALGKARQKGARPWSAAIGVINRLKVLRGAGESCSDVILRISKND
jgi:hypothetical protein